MDHMFRWKLMECFIDERAKEMLKGRGEAHERGLLIFMWPVSPNDGCQER